jgi:hypothetical protein
VPRSAARWKSGTILAPFVDTVRTSASGPRALGGNLPARLGARLGIGLRIVRTRGMSPPFAGQSPSVRAFKKGTQNGSTVEVLTFSTVSPGSIDTAMDLI